MDVILIFRVKSRKNRLYFVFAPVTLTSEPDLQGSVTFLLPLSYTQTLEGAAGILHLQWIILPTIHI
jgi:hypothetical protein